MRRISPLADIWISIAGINELILKNDILVSVVFEIFHIENLCVRVVVNTDDLRVRGVGDINDVHVVPTCLVGVHVTIGGTSNGNFSISWRCQWVECKLLDVVGARFVLAGV